MWCSMIAAALSLTKPLEFKRKPESMFKCANAEIRPKGQYAVYHLEVLWAGWRRLWADYRRQVRVGVGLADLGQQISAKWLTGSVRISWQERDPRL